MTTSNEIWSEWIEWNGGKCPVKAGVVHQLRFQNGEKSRIDDYAPSWNWNETGQSSIIAYRYKLDDEAMPKDLEWLARNVSEWGAKFGSTHIVKTAKGADYVIGHVDPDGKFRGKGHVVLNAYTRDEWKSARQKLGLDSSDSDETHNNPTPEEDDAFRHVEQMCGSDKPTAADILRAGMGHMEERASTYDKPQGERSMAATVAAFEEVTGIDMTEEQGWLFMVLLKAVRSQQGNFKLDNYEDLAAYAGLCGEAAAIERS